MGSVSSKPARKLASTVLKEASALPRSRVDTLPPQELRDRYAQLQQPFDAAKLTKKLRARHAATSPAGKDGFDPQEGAPHPAGADGAGGAFADSVMRLGAQIETHSVGAAAGPEATALRQLRKRRELHLRGERENDNERAGAPAARRTMIHPRSLGGLLTDVHDARVPRQRIVDDYHLAEDFLPGLGRRLRLATTMEAVEEKARDGEVLVQTAAPSPLQPPAPPAPKVDENGQMLEVDPKRLQQMRGRLGLDEPQ